MFIFYINHHPLCAQIQRQCRGHNDRLQDLTTRAAFVNNSGEAKALLRHIDEYIDHHETNQLNSLGRLSEASRELFGCDKSVSLYAENITVFDSFLRTKNKLVEYLKEQDSIEKEAKRLALENEKNAAPPQQAPKFYQGLQDGKVEEGDRFVFKCAVHGVPTPNVEWFKDGISIQNNSDFQTTFNNGLCTLTIEETMLADTANFHCRASSSAGQDETLARLFVTESLPTEALEAPVFSLALTTGFAMEKSAFVFECVVTGHPLPIVQWFKGNVCVDQLPDYTITYNNGHATLKIEEVCLDDQTTFMCRGINPAGSAETIANLIVNRNICHSIFKKRASHQCPYLYSCKPGRKASCCAASDQCDGSSRPKTEAGVRRNRQAPTKADVEAEQQTHFPSRCPGLLSNE